MTKRCDRNERLWKEKNVEQSFSERVYGAQCCHYSQRQNWYIRLLILIQKYFYRQYCYWAKFKRVNSDILNSRAGLWIMVNETPLIKKLFKLYSSDEIKLIFFSCSTVFNFVLRCLNQFELTKKKKRPEKSEKMIKYVNLRTSLNCLRAWATSINFLLKTIEEKKN